MTTYGMDVDLDAPITLHTTFIDALLGCLSIAYIRNLYTLGLIPCLSVTPFI